jgi:cytoskeleton protein RodZ
VRALENNDFGVLGAPVFAKGHLRKYAQLVKVDEADVMADYYRLNRSSDVQTVVFTRPTLYRTVSPLPWVGAIAVIVIAATAYWWFTSRETPPVRPVTGEIAPLPQETDVAAPPLQDDVETPDEAATIEPEVVPEPEQDSLPIVTEDPLAMSLSITYSGDCWTEITDASGRRLFFALGKSGRTVDLTGAAPFNVLFGDAANVSLVVNGSAFDIPTANRRGRTARLTITGS